MNSKELERTIRLLREAVAEIDAGLTMSAKAGILNAIEFLERCRQPKENDPATGTKYANYDQLEREPV